MNIKEIVCTPRFFIELLLCFIIVTLLINRGPEIRVDPNGFVKNTSLNFALTGDGAVIVSDRKGNVILSSAQDSLNNKLHNISIATMGGNKKNNSLTQGLLESLIPSAVAEQLVKQQINLDGQVTCLWYDDYTPC